MKLWIRVGDYGEYYSFDDIDDALYYLNDLCVGQVLNWVCTGFETCRYWGEDYISFYWGDKDGNMGRTLDVEEKNIIECCLLETSI